MAGPTVCGNCGTAVPRSALFCAKCGRPVFLLIGRRARRARDASVLGLAGSLLMALQAVLMLATGGIAIVALRIATEGDLTGAVSVAYGAAITVGFALLFDLVGIGLLTGAFSLHTRMARAAATFAGNDLPRRALAFRGLLTTLFLALWLAVTLAWRGALAAFVTFYPSPLGVDLGVGFAELRRAASIMLGLWVAAAFLLFLGALFGTTFLQRARGRPLTFWRLLWPLEALIHFCAAVAIALAAPGLLSDVQIDLGELQLIGTLGVIELLVVPILGCLAYLVLFREFYGMYREAPWSGSPRGAAAPAEPPGGTG